MDAKVGTPARVRLGGCGKRQRLRGTEARAEFVRGGAGR